MEYGRLMQGIPYTGQLSAGEAALVTQDSRKVVPGAVFVCVKGHSSDGHLYARQALQAGAGLLVTQSPLGLANEVVVQNSRAAYALLCRNFFGNPAQKLTMVAVTGTNGKTTVSSVIKQMLQNSGIQCGLIGTIRSEIGTMEIPAKFTTPEAWDLNALLHRMVAAGCTHVVMEASSQALEQGRLHGLQFALAIFTNLTRDHLDYHQTMENYYEAKKILFGQCDAMLTNIDDEWGARLLKEAGCPRRYSFSCRQAAADFYAEDLQLAAGGVRFIINTRAQRQAVAFAMPGEYSVYNALAAGAAAVLLGLSPAKAAGQLARVPGVPGRCEVLYDGSFTIICDFAHTGDAMEKLLSTLRPFAKGRMLVLFGCAGNRDPVKREPMGRAAAQYGDIVFLTSDNPRSESEAAIAAGALPPLQKKKGPYYVELNREKALRKALGFLAEGDMLVLCGKGHEDYQVLNGVTVYLSERQIVSDWLKARARPGEADKAAN